MNLRNWTAEKITEGGTIFFFAGMFVKLAIELGGAAVASFLIVKFLLRFTPVSSLETAFGATTKPTLWLIITAGLSGFFFCKYTEPVRS